MKAEKSRNILLHIITPFILLALCSGIFIIAMIKPSDKIKVYLNLAFMDSMKSSPDSDNTGLVIKDTEIINNYEGDISETGEVIRPSFGEQFAVLSSDVMGIDVPVYWGSESELFEHGACQASYSVLPGKEGHTVISAHVNTFFADLDKLTVGDSVTIRTNYGEFIYTVRELIAFKSSENKYAAPSKETKLTLYTCQKDVLGNSDERTGVVCDLTESRFYNTEESAE